jgi:methionyl-tRNA formyltransferase
MPIKIVFFGTPAFAVPTLQALMADNRFEVMAVVSQPDKPSGRGQQLQPTPVKQLAQAANIPVHQPVSLRKDDALLVLLAGLQADVFVTIAFGQILSQPVLDIPRLGTVNVHASLLPLYRGANPIQWAVIDGQTVTGLTTMLTDIGVDTGDMLLTDTTPISPEDTALTVAERLANMGGPLLINTLLALQAGTITPVPQPHAEATHAPKLNKADAAIDLQQPAHVVLNRIRGQQPWPGALVMWQDQPLKIMAAKLLAADELALAAPSSNQPLPEPHIAKQLLPGQLICQPKPLKLLLGTGTHPLELLTIQPPGKKAMAAADWLRGLPANTLPSLIDAGV